VGRQRGSGANPKTEGGRVKKKPGPLKKEEPSTFLEGEIGGLSAWGSKASPQREEREGAAQGGEMPGVPRKDFQHRQAEFLGGGKEAQGEEKKGKTGSRGGRGLVEQLAVETASKGEKN